MLRAEVVRLEAGETKNDEGRMVYLDEELGEIFRRQWGVHQSNAKSGRICPYVFLNKRREDTVKRFDKAWKRACRDSGIGIRLFHDLRRTAVRNMVRSGTPESVAMKVSGHKTRSVFERYNIVSDNDLRLASQRQQEYLDTQMVTNSVTVRYLNPGNTRPRSSVMDRARDS